MTLTLLKQQTSDRHELASSTTDPRKHKKYSEIEKVYFVKLIHFGEKALSPASST